jgi:rare lipoprotein A (peptidoglycan hydrolase)
MFGISIKISISMSNKVWISLTAASATVLLHPLFPAVAGNQPTQVSVNSPLPQATITELSVIQPVKISQYFPQPSTIVEVPDSKERRTDSSKPSGSWGPLDSTEPTSSPEITAPSENVLQTQTGQASWYGYEAGNMTATGERYNARALTAAHKTLPFGTRVRVVNLRNGRTVVVRINDRGPYIRGRIIDLSAAAAEEVGLTTSGVANVRLDILSYGSGKRKSRR